MPAITTFGGATVRSFGRGIEQVPATFPANTVVFYHLTNTNIQPATPNADWSVLNTSEKYITGTATQAEIGTTSTASGLATPVGSTGTAGGHGSGTSFITPPYGGAVSVYSNYAGTAGDHTHSLTTVDLSTARANTISITTITTTQSHSLIPANCIVFRKIAPTSLNFSALSLSGNGYFYGTSSAANTTWLDRSTTGGAIGTTVGASGTHSHVTASNYYSWSGTYASNLNVSSGNHNDHAIEFNVEIRLASRYLKAWVSSADEPVEYGMIVMYRGDLTKLPAGWRVCDGSAGTPDMRNNAVAWASSGTHGDVFYSTGAAVLPTTQFGSYQYGTTSTSSWPHTHLGGSSTARGSNGLHTNLNASHAHSFTVTSISSSSYAHPYYKLAFIQYKGI